jgi:hypothetical protein
MKPSPANASRRAPQAVVCLGVLRLRVLVLLLVLIPIGGRVI